jgi:hypothetical protein
VAKAGRRTRYKTLELEIPRAVAIPTCDSCGAEWIDRPTARAIDRALETVYRDTLRAVWGEVMRKLVAQTSMRRVEQALGLSEGYLSKVSNGRSAPSIELVSNLGLIAKDVESRLREIDGIWHRGGEGTAVRSRSAARRSTWRRRSAAA